MKRTQLVARKLGRLQLKDAQKSFDAKVQYNAWGRQVHPQGDGKEVPLVLYFDSPGICNSLLTNCVYEVPSGVSAIKQKFGADYPPGPHLAKPGQNVCDCLTSVKYIVTKQTISYDAPVKECPTKDNVMIICELTLMFRIGPEPKKVKDFVYKLGAARFNLFLSVAVDEGIRQLIRQFPLSKVLELRGSSGKHIEKVMDNLKAKFDPFGVTFTSAVINSVKLDKELMKKMEATTTFKTKETVDGKKHQTQMLKIKQAHELDLKKIDKKYERELQDIESDKKVAMLKREEKIIKANEAMQNAIVNAQMIAETAETRARAQKDNAKLQAQQAVSGIKAKVEAECEALRIAAESDAQVNIDQSKALVEVAQKNAAALGAQAKAEGESSKGLRSVREWELEMAKCEVAELVARKNKIVIGGDMGNRIIDSVCSESIFAKGGIKLQQEG